MKPEDLVVPPPIPKTMDYPATTGIAIGIVFVTVLLIVSNRFDPTKGVLTISLMVVVAFLGLVVFASFFTIPNDQMTSAVIGGLIAAFSAVIVHWIGRNGGGSRE